MSVLKKRLFPVLFGCLILAFFAEHMVFRAVMAEYVPFYYTLLGTFSDIFWPLVFLSAGLFFSSGIAISLSVLSFLIVFFIKSANIAIFAELFEILNYSTWRMLMDHTDAKSLEILFGPLWLLKGALIVLPFLVVLALFLWTGIKYVRSREHPAFANKLKISVLILLLVSTGCNVYYLLKCEDLGKTYFKREFVVRPANVWYHEFAKERAKVQRLKHRVPERGFFPGRISAESEAILRKWGVLPFSAEAPASLKPEFRKILIVAVESLNLDYFRTVNPEMPEGLTPFLDEISGQYLSLKNYYTGSQPTSWGLGATFLSRTDYDLDLSLKSDSVCDPLNRDGWETFYFSPMTRMLYNNGADFERLFRPRKEYFLEDICREFGWKGNYYWGLSDQEIFEIAFRVLEKQNRFFAVVSTIDLHDPYTVTGPAAELPSTGNPFLDALRGTDRNLGDFVHRIMESPMFDESTLLILTADHSATFGVNYTKRPNFNPERIPLILITKDNRLANVLPDANLCSQLDLAPTLLGLLGYPAGKTFMGRDMRSGKNFAISKCPGVLIIHLPGGVNHVLRLEDGPRSPEERALFEYYDTFYGVTQGKKPKPEK